MKFNGKSIDFTVLPHFGAKVIPETIELTDNQEQVIAVSEDGKLVRTYPDPNGKQTPDGRKFGYGINQEVDALNW